MQSGEPWLIEVGWYVNGAYASGAPTVEITAPVSGVTNWWNGTAWQTGATTFAMTADAETGLYAYSVAAIPSAWANLQVTATAKMTGFPPLCETIDIVQPAVSYGGHF